MNSQQDTPGRDRMVRLVQELAYHAEGNRGDGCWDLYDRYNPVADAGAVILLPGEQPPWHDSPSGTVDADHPGQGRRTKD